MGDFGIPYMNGRACHPVGVYRDVFTYECPLGESVTVDRYPIAQNDYRWATVKANEIKAGLVLHNGVCLSAPAARHAFLAAPYMRSDSPLLGTAVCRQHDGSLRVANHTGYQDWNQTALKLLPPGTNTFPSSGQILRLMLKKGITAGAPLGEPSADGRRQGTFVVDGRAFQYTIGTQRRMGPSFDRLVEGKESIEVEGLGFIDNVSTVRAFKRAVGLPR